MHDKRFTLAYEKGKWWAVRDGTITLWKEETIHTLNEQDKRIIELENENKNLKQQNKKYIMMVNSNSELNDEIYEQLQKTEKKYKFLLNENEQLKQEIETLHEQIAHFEIGDDWE